MMYPTHVAGGISLGGIAYMIAPVGGPIPFMAGAIVGSLIPDLDHPNAFLNKRARSVSVLAAFGHRTLTHSLLFTFIFIGILLVGGLWQSLCMGLFWGILSHLVLDTLNPTGVPWLWPYARKFSVSKIRTGGAGEYLFLLVMCVAIYLFFKIA